MQYSLLYCEWYLKIFYWKLRTIQNLCMRIMIKKNVKVPTARSSNAVIYIFVIICSSSLHNWQKKWDHPQRPEEIFISTIKQHEIKHVFIQIDYTNKSHTYCIAHYYVDLVWFQQKLGHIMDAVYANHRWGSYI